MSFLLFDPASRSPSAKRAKSSAKASPRTDGCKLVAWILKPSVWLFDFFWSAKATGQVVPKRFATVDKASLAWTEKKKSSSLTVTAGSERRTILRMAESTFGAGTKTVRAR